MKRALLVSFLLFSLMIFLDMGYSSHIPGTFYTQIENGNEFYTYTGTPGEYEIKWYANDVELDFYCEVNDGGNIVACDGFSPYCVRPYSWGTDCNTNDPVWDWNNVNSKRFSMPVTCSDDSVCKWQMVYRPRGGDGSALGDYESSLKWTRNQPIAIDKQEPDFYFTVSPKAPAAVEACGNNYDDYDGSGAPSDGRYRFSGPGGGYDGWIGSCDYIENLDPNEKYCGFTAEARDKVGNINSDPESVCAFTKARKPSNPEILNRGSDFIAIEPSSLDGNPSHTKYKISVFNSEEYISDDFDQAELYQEGGVKIDGLKEDTIYKVRIKVRQDAGFEHGGVEKWRDSSAIEFRTLRRIPINISITADKYLKTLKETREKIPSCGNTICEEHKGENENSCPSDCRPDVGPCNQDGVCDSLSGETSLSCPSDCEIDGSDLPDPSEVEPGDLDEEISELNDTAISKIDFNEFVSGDDYIDLLFHPRLLTTLPESNIVLQAPDGRSIVLTLISTSDIDSVAPVRYYFNGTVHKYSSSSAGIDFQGKYGIGTECHDGQFLSKDEFEIEVYGDLQGAAADGDWIIKKSKNTININPLANSFLALNVQGKTYTNEDDCEGSLDEDTRDVNPITIWDWKNNQEKTNLESYINEKSISATAVSPQILIPTQYYKPDGSSEYQDNYIRGWISRNSPITITFPDLSTMTIACRESYCPDEERKYFRLDLPEVQGGTISNSNFNIEGTIIDKPLDGTITIGHEESDSSPGLFGYRDKEGPGNAIELNIRDRTFSSTTEKGCLIDDEEYYNGEYGVTYSANPTSLWNWHETEKGTDYCEYNEHSYIIDDAGEMSQPTDPEVSPANYRFYLLYSAGQGTQEALMQYVITSYEQLCRILDDTRDSLLNGNNIETFCRDPTSMQKACEIVFAKEICNDYIIDITGEPVQDTLGGTGLMTKISEKILPFYSWVEGLF